MKQSIQKHRTRAVGQDAIAFHLPDAQTSIPTPAFQWTTREKASRSTTSSMHLVADEVLQSLIMHQAHKDCRFQGLAGGEESECRWKRPLPFARFFRISHRCLSFPYPRRRRLCSESFRGASVSERREAFLTWSRSTVFRWLLCNFACYWGVILLGDASKGLARRFSSGRRRLLKLWAA